MTNEGDKWKDSPNQCYFCGEKSKMKLKTTAGEIPVCGCKECFDYFTSSFDITFSPKKK